MVFFQALLQKLKDKQDEFETLSQDSFKQIDSIHMNEMQKIQNEFVELSTKWNSILQLLDDRLSKIELHIQNCKKLDDEFVMLETWLKDIEKSTQENERMLLDSEIESIQEILNLLYVSTYFIFYLSIYSKHKRTNLELNIFTSSFCDYGCCRC